MPAQLPMTLVLVKCGKHELTNKHMLISLFPRRAATML